MINNINITDNAKRLFVLYAANAAQSCAPLTGGNVRLLSLRQDRRLLTSLKRAGLITTFASNGAMWVEFTAAGRELAVSLIGLDFVGSK